MLITGAAQHPTGIHTIKYFIRSPCFSSILCSVLWFTLHVVSYWY